MRAASSVAVFAIALLAPAALGQEESPDMEFLFEMDSLTTLSLVVTVKFDDSTNPPSEQMRSGLDQQGNKNGKVDDAEAAKFENLVEDSVADSMKNSEEGSAGGIKLDGKDYEDRDEDPAVESSGLRGSSVSDTGAVLVRVTLPTRLDGSPASGSNHELTVEDDGNETGDEEEASGAVTIRVPPDFKITSVTGDLRKNSDCEAGASNIDDVEEFAIAFTSSKGSCGGGKDDGGFLPGIGPVLVLAVVALLGLGMRPLRKA